MKREDIERARNGNQSAKGKETRLKVSCSKVNVRCNILYELSKNIQFLGKKRSDNILKSKVVRSPKPLRYHESKVANRRQVDFEYIFKNNTDAGVSSRVSHVNKTGNCNIRARINPRLKVSSTKETVLRRSLDNNEKEIITSRLSCPTVSSRFLYLREIGKRNIRTRRQASKE